MAPEIKVDDDVFAELQKRAVPLVDTPNTVLRGLLGLDPNGTDPAAVEDEPTPKRSRRRRSKARRERAPRVAAGTILPQTEYDLPILQAVAEFGGRGPTRDVVERVGELLADRLTDLDKRKLESGEVRWRNRVQFTRLRLIREGFLKADSPRGTWELTDKGKRRVSEGSK